jgi:EAL domain-containing protein (putative c-di-GMP-specific phosphodiesterase class I)
MNDRNPKGRRSEPPTVRPAGGAQAVRIQERVATPPTSGVNLLSLARSAPPQEPAGAPASGVFLGRIVRADQLSVVFQPIVSLDTGAPFACEALVRCSVPKYANPEHLFAESVNVGCAGQLGRMIREVATPLCRDLPVFLNVHPRELHEPWLIRPDDPIFTHATDVYLEITETVPFEHFDICHDVLREIRWRGGVHLVVDDLGAGYSNLKRIADLEPKVVKLDRELIRELHENVRQRRLVASVVRLCVEMGATVVAEGIETEDELSAIRDAGAHYGQGYLFARPAFPIPKVHWPGAGR